MNILKNRLFTSALFIYLLASCSQSGGDKQETTRLNVLMIAVDDLRPELGCYGNQLIKSPNIDKLAGQGIVFKNSFCNIPVCGASRASILTGTRPTRYRFLSYMARADEEVPHAMPIHQLFKENGYRTVSNGKVFHDFKDHADSWDENWRSQNESGWLDYQLEVNQQINGNEKRGPSFEAVDLPDSAYNDGKLALKTISDLKRLKESGGPFFLATGFVKPHLPFNAPQKYWDLYSRNDFAPTSKEFWPREAPDEAFHNFGELRNYYGIPKTGPLSDSLSVTLQHGYYACISYIDQQIGLIMDALNELGLRENTIVVLWGDHGWNLGEHGLWCKHCNFNTSLAAPLIISAPGMSKGAQAESMTEFIDIYPTLAELSGLPIPETVEGKSLVPVLENPEVVSKDFVIAKWGNGLTIRSQQYAYTEWRKDDDTFISSMLYDHFADPQEANNLANDPENTALMDSLGRLMKANRGADYFIDTSVKQNGELE